MDGIIHYTGGIDQKKSWNVRSVSTPAAGIYDVVFGFVSRSGDADRFVVHAERRTSTGTTAYGNVTAIGADTVTIRFTTYDAAGLASATSWMGWFKEM